MRARQGLLPVCVCPGCLAQLPTHPAPPSLRPGGSDDDDLADYDRVWLIGEQRWENRGRVKKDP